MKVKVDQYYMTFDDSQEAIDFFKNVIGDGTGVIESYFPGFSNMSNKF